MITAPMLVVLMSRWFNECGSNESVSYLQKTIVLEFKILSLQKKDRNQNQY